MKAKEERDLDEQEELEREEWNRKSHILPLGFAATDELFDKSVKCFLYAKLVGFSTVVGTRPCQIMMTV